MLDINKLEAIVREQVDSGLGIHKIAADALFIYAHDSIENLDIYADDSIENLDYKMGVLTFASDISNALKYNEVPDAETVLKKAFGSTELAVRAVKDNLSQKMEALKADYPQLADFLSSSYNRLHDSMSAKDFVNLCTRIFEKINRAEEHTATIDSYNAILPIVNAFDGSLFPFIEEPSIVGSKMEDLEIASRAGPFLREDHSGKLACGMIIGRYEFDSDISDMFKAGIRDAANAFTELARRYSY